MLKFLNGALETLRKTQAPSSIIGNTTLSRLSEQTAIRTASAASLGQLVTDLDLKTLSSSNGAISGPTELHVFATHRCQLNCTFCPGHSPLLAPSLGEQYTKRELDLDTFRYVWQQQPTLRSVLFSGWGEPLLNPQVLAMADHAWQDRQAPATLVTNGLLLDIHHEILLMSQGLTLVVSLNGHSPSSYRTCTGMDPGNFSHICEQVRWLIQQRQKRRLKIPHKKFIRIELSFIVGIQTLAALPAMVELAQELGVDGIRLNNIMPLNPVDPQISPPQPFDQALTQQNEALNQQLARMASRAYPIPIIWPILMSKETAGRRYCSAPHNVLTLDGDCTVGNCAVLPHSPSASDIANSTSKGWETNGWTSVPLQRLRDVHTPDSLLPIPSACRSCMHNCG